MLTDPDEDFLFLLGLLVDAQRAVFLVGGFLHPTCAHVPSPPTKQLDGLGESRAFVPAILLAETKTKDLMPMKDRSGILLNKNNYRLFT